ncbi:MAG: hypothetical protein ACPGED_03955 [Flavobacteriales bacterium]
MMILYTLVSVGVMVHQHNCCHGFTALEINGVDLYDTNCCHDDISSCDESGCCSDDALYLALEDEHQLSTTPLYVALLSRCNIKTPSFEAIVSNVEQANVDQDSPRGPPLYLMYSAYVFYG